MSKRKLKMGYGIARMYLESYIKRMKNSEDKRDLLEVLNDFEYCIDKTWRLEQIIEAKKLLKDAYGKGLYE